MVGWCCRPLCCVCCQPIITVKFAPSGHSRGSRIDTGTHHSDSPAAQGRCVATDVLARGAW